MYKNIVMLAGGKVEGIKQVGVDCVLSGDYVEIPVYNALVMGTNYNSQTQTFTDEQNNVIYSF